MASAIDILNSVRNEFGSARNTEDLIASVNEALPLNPTHFTINGVYGTPNKFVATVDCFIENIDTFITRYTEKTSETLRKMSVQIQGENGEYEKTYPYRCQHRTYHPSTMNPKEAKKREPSKRFQNTNCPFRLTLKERTTITNNRNFLLTLTYNHNHETKSLEALTFKDISPAIEKRIRTLFDLDYTPALAYRECLKHLQSQCSDELEFHLKLADRSLMPSRRDFNNLYSNFKNEKFGSTDIKTMFDLLKARIMAIKESDDNFTIELNEFSQESPLILLIITPLMKRVHTMIGNSGDLAFLDSSSNMEEFNLRVFLLVTHSPVGTLPLAEFVTSDEITNTLIQALDLLKTNLPEGAFYGKGDSGPNVVMTDNCSELREALTHTWPNTTPLLCVFHLLQQIWRWLFEKRHGVRSEDRVRILNLFKSVLYEKEIDEMETKFEEMTSSEIVSQYPKLVSYFNNIYDIKAAWALCFRKNLRLRGMNTNNSVESQFLVIKDKILSRTKEVNINGLLKKLCTDLDDHYKTKLLSVASGKFDGCYAERFKGKNTTGRFKVPSPEKINHVLPCISKLGDRLYTVPSFTDETKSYLVDLEVNCCGCSAGYNGDVCKHQYLLWASRISDSTNFLPYLSPTERQRYATIATGSCLPLKSYEGIHDQLDDIPLPPEEFNSDESYPIPPSASEEPSQQNEVIVSVEREETTTEELEAIIKQASEDLIRRLRENENNTNFKEGVQKFCERVQKFPMSKLSNALHSFGSATNTSLKVTATSCLKKAKRGKIYVQPEAVKRRKVTDGSRNAKVKGMSIRESRNPFRLRVERKRLHKFSANVENNEPVSKKAGRTMSSRTKHHGKGFAQSSNQKPEKQ